MLDADSPREPVKVVADVIQAEMGLDDAHCLIGEQKWDIPPDKQLFVVFFDETIKRIGQTTKLDQTVSPPVEVQTMSCLHPIRIEIMSYISTEARKRAPEVMLALESFLARDLMGKYNCQISSCQAPVDASAAEETGMLIRYVARVNVTALHVKTKQNAGYYDKFNQATVDGSAKVPEIDVNA